MVTAPPAVVERCRLGAGGGGKDAREEAAAEEVEAAAAEGQQEEVTATGAPGGNGSTGAVAPTTSTSSTSTSTAVAAPAIKGAVHVHSEFGTHRDYELENRGAPPTTVAFLSSHHPLRLARRNAGMRALNARRLARPASSLQRASRRQQAQPLLTCRVNSLGPTT